MFIIANKFNDNLFWNSESGWSSIEEADFFTQEDMQSLEVVKNGYWCPLWSVDFIQFARTLSEVLEINLLSDSQIMRIAESMNLDVDNIYSLLSRAQCRWEEFKEKVERYKVE